MTLYSYPFCIPSLALPCLALPCLPVPSRPSRSFETGQKSHQDITRHGTSNYVQFFRPQETLKGNYLGKDLIQYSISSPDGGGGVVVVVAGGGGDGGGSALLHSRSRPRVV
ncbi:hypothetical protein E2C01_076395 [Portunus trituberculatus]|uniref:Uncharacterized protein n=1 Tax=Portunus trituberculatus TaxID=210409 RepID=A0A5B7ID52_PORTR|nr:hypothetical protein [Portunus trituberculatus]